MTIPQALERLNILKTEATSTSVRAAYVLSWLDMVTSYGPEFKMGVVQLQGPEDQFETWGEVERYLLPDTPLASFNVKGVGGKPKDAFDGTRTSEGNLASASNISFI